MTEDRIREVAAEFEGRIQQVPPMYSAVKVDGVRLYKSARAGHDVERQAREATVFHLDIVGIQIRDVARVACSKGTYIRTLCADIGHKLGVGGHMSTLVRERVGPLKVEQALTVDEVESRLEQGTLSASMLTLDEALAGLPACTVGAGTARRVCTECRFPFRKSWHGTDRRPCLRDRIGRFVSRTNRDVLLAIGTLRYGADIEKLGPGERRLLFRKYWLQKNHRTVEL